MDQPIAPTPPRPKSRKRRLLVGLAFTLVVASVFVATLPTLLGTAPARGLLVRVVNGRLAPGRVELGRASLSWTRPIELGDFALVDPRGKTVLSARSLRTDRGLLGLLKAKGKYGTIRVDGATVDVERRADGSIDALEALAGLMKSDGDSSPSDPGLAVSVVIQGKGFRIAAPELPDGLTADAFQGVVAIAPGLPLDATLTLRKPGRSLDVDASYDHRAPAGTPADLHAGVGGKDWPIAVARDGIVARGRLVGGIDVGRKGGLWKASGGPELREFVVEGPTLAGDRVAVASVSLGCDVAQTDAGWSIHEFEFKSPIAALGASGTVPATPGAQTTVQGRVDLAALAKMLPHLLPLRDGLAIERGLGLVRVDLASAGGSERIKMAASVAELAAVDHGRPLALREPAAVAADLTRAGGKVAVTGFEVRGVGIAATATGDLDRGITLDGTVDLAKARGQVGDWLDLGALDVAGQARIKADYRRKDASYQARFAAELDGLKVVGLAAEPIARDHARVEATATGPSGPSGIPAGLNVARAGLDAGDVKAGLDATAQGDALSLVVAASGPVPAPIPARGEVRLAFRNASGPAREIDELRLALVPLDPQHASARIALATRGQFDPAAGELTLTPIAGEPGAGVVLAPEGIKVVGINKPGQAPTIAATLGGELGALDRMIGVWTRSAPYGLAGDWAGQVAVARNPDGVIVLNGGLNVPNLVATTPRGPLAIALHAAYAPGIDLVHVEKLDVTTGYARVVAAGNVANATGSRSIDITGKFDPIWEGIDPLIASSVEPGAQVRASGQPFHLKGPVAGGSASQVLRALEGEIGLDLASARAFGMVVGPTPVVLRLAGGKAAFDPIRTTINDGPVEIVAELDLDDPNALALRVAPGSKIDGATINEAVSHDVLSYIAPVLSQASQVRGKVSLGLDGAVVPILGAGSMRADGRVVFQEVVFQPGTFTTELFGLTGLKTPRMTLHQALQIRVADGRVHQEGLTIAVGGDSKVKVDGSVGLDQTLALRASLPVTARMLGHDAKLEQIVGDTRITVPIGGTLSRPAIDQRAVQVALKDAARGMVRRGVQNSLGEALNQVVPRPSGGDAPKAARGRNRGPAGGDALKILEGVGRDLIDPKKKP